MSLFIKRLNLLKTNSTMWENYEGWLPDEAQPMSTLSDQGILTHDDALDVAHAGKYTEIGQFVSEDGSDYTDLRKPLCGCGK